MNSQTDRCDSIILKAQRYLGLDLVQPGSDRDLTMLNINAEIALVLVLSFELDRLRKIDWFHAKSGVVSSACELQLDLLCWRRFSGRVTSIDVRCSNI